MSDDNTFFVFIESLPSELTISVICLILLCFCCCIKDFLICCWRERRANQRMSNLQRLKKETAEIEIVKSIEENIKTNSKYKTRDVVGALV